MHPLQMSGQGSSKGGGLLRVPKHAVIDALADGVEHGGRRTKIHVCHPERENVAAGPAVPLFGAGAATVGAVLKGCIVNGWNGWVV